jgi:predicted ATP-binding protein involved in virulence
LGLGRGEGDLDSDRFFVKDLLLENLRCFERIELGPFDPHFNLLVGANGVGKSSVLLALANLFRSLATPRGAIAYGKIFNSKDVRLENQTGADGSRRQKVHWPGRATASFAMGEDALIASEEVGTPLGAFGPELWRSATTTPLVSTSDYLSKVANAAYPLLAFFSTRRFFQSTSADNGVQAYFPGERGQAFANWLDAGTSANALRDWMRDQTLVALQLDRLDRDSGRDISATRALRQLMLVQGAIRESVEGAKTIEYDAERKDIVVYIEDGRILDFSSMSDGQRALIGLVAEIARRACLLNAPYLGAEVLSKTTGIVLIDELDLHLHPRWQRRVIGDLKHIFPNIQFFATTHSPQVIGEALPQEVILLTELGQKKPAQSFGMDSNWILECVMEAEGRDPEIALRIKALFNAIEDGRFEDARGEISDLRKDIGEAPDIVGAESYLWNLEHSGDEAAE